MKTIPQPQLARPLRHCRRFFTVLIVLMSVGLCRCMLAAPIAQQGYLKASNTGECDYFGLSVAVSGDTMVVGAYHEDSSATGVNGNQSDNSAVDSGVAYV